MNWDFDAMRQNVIGTVDAVSASEIKVLLEVQAPQNIAFNTGVPTRFPRINGYVLIPNEVGALVGMITSIGIEHSKYPARKGFKDFDLLELPFPLRKMYLVPVGTLSHQDNNIHESVYLLDRGVFNFPSVGDPVIIPTAEQEKAILEINDLQAVVHIGNAAQNNAIPIKVDPDKLFGRHLAVLGNTGSGKSCTVAGLIRWSLEAAERKRKDYEMPVNARFIILDPNGEYSRAFSDENDPFKDSVIKYEVHLPDLQKDNSESFAIPAWFWNCNEWISYTRAAPGIQRPILIDALSAIKSGREIEASRLKPIYDEVSGYKRLIDICISQIASYQSGVNLYSLSQTIKNLNEDLKMWRSKSSEELDINQALESLEVKVKEISDSHFNGKGFPIGFSANSLTPIATGLSELLELFPEDIIQTETGPDVPKEFDLSRIGEYIQASALINDRDMRNFTASLEFRVRTLFSDIRLKSIINPESAISFLEWIEQFLGKANKDCRYGRVSIINLSLVPSDIIHMIVAIFSRLILEAHQRYRRKNGIELPTTLVLEEAHSFIRHVPSDDDMSYSRLCRDTFERIAREGRKFGLGLLLSSQRPSELSTTVLSQCNTFILHRLVNDKDQEYVRRLVPDNISGLLNELPNLPTRKAIMVGWATQIPVLMEIRELPDEQRPQSSDPEFWNVWTGKEKVPRKFNWDEVVSEWQGKSVNLQKDFEER